MIARVGRFSHPGKRFVTLMLSLLMSSVAHRQAAASEADCTTPGRAWVRLVLSRDLQVPADPLAQHLRVALAAIEIAVCLRGATAPSATIELAPLPGEARVRVAIHDAVTVKKVERDVDLSKIPADGHPLTLAVVANELLGASWAELLLQTAATPAAPVPEAVSRSVDRALGLSGPRSIGAAVVFDWYSGGQAQSGVDARGGFRLHESVTLTARVGGRWSAPVEAPPGRVLASALIFGLGSAWTTTPRAKRAGLELHLRLDALRVQLSGQPGALASGNSASRFSARATSGPIGWFALNRALRLELEGAFGYTLLPVRAYYGSSIGSGRVATAVSGLILGGGVGISGSF